MQEITSAVSPVINSLWIGDKLSALEWLSIKSHLFHGHQYHLWTYDELDVPEGTVLKYAGEIISEDGVFAYKVGEGKGSYSAVSNIFRYRLLREVGGWWCDTDVIALKPFDFTEKYVFASETHRNGSSSPTTCVIKCPQMSLLMASCEASARKHDRETLEWGTIGPDLLSKWIFKLDLQEYVQPPATFCPTNWFEADEYPPMKSWNITDRSFAVHMWNEMWRRAGVDKDGVYPGSLYERLHRCYSTGQEKIGLNGLEILKSICG